MRAVRSQVNMATRLRPRSANVLRSAASVQSREIASAISSVLSGSNMRAASPACSGSDVTLAHAAGTSWRPHVISLRSASWAGDGNGCKDG